MWTQFWDMASGGGCKEEPYQQIYIEADSEEEAKVIFQNKFHHNPERVTCTCCGGDYSISSAESFDQLTGYHRSCAYDKILKKYLEKQNPDTTYKTYMTVEEYKKQVDVLVISADEIKPEWREGELRQEGYVWMGG